MGTPVSATPSGTGSTPGTTAARGAWTSSPSRPRPSTTGLRDSSTRTCRTSGHLVACATLTAATVPTSSPRTSTAGSGPPTRLVSPPPTPTPSTTGPAPEDSGLPAASPTTGNRSSKEESLSRAWPCSTTSTATASSGTTWPATTRSPSSARTSRATFSLPGESSPTLPSPKKTAALKDSFRILSRYWHLHTSYSYNNTFNLINAILLLCVHIQNQFLPTSVFTLNLGLSSYDIPLFIYLFIYLLLMYQCIQCVS